jgi:hypothetical protein
VRKVACLALALVAAGCGGGEETPAVPQGRNIAVSRSLEPKAAFFGEPVVARVEVVVDRRRFDPVRVRVVPQTFPYRPYTELSVDRRDSDRYTRLTFEVGLRCLYYACLPRRVDIPGAPYRDQRVTRFQAWHVYYDDPKTKKPRHVARVWWPSLEAVSNLDLTDVSVTFGQQFPGRISPATLPAVTYRLSPPLAATLLLLAAALLLAYPAWLLMRWRESRRPPPPPPEPPLPPLERALLLVEWARDQVDGEDRRKALEELAFRLDEAGREGQAASARRLAWSAGSPSPEAADALVEEVRGDRERRGGRLA